MASSEIILEAVSSVSQIPAADWEACANPRRGPGVHNGLDRSVSPNTADNSCTDLTFSYNPFVSHAFFAAAEASKTASITVTTASSTASSPVASSSSSH